MTAAEQAQFDTSVIIDTIRFEIGNGLQTMNLDAALGGLPDIVNTVGISGASTTFLTQAIRIDGNGFITGSIPDVNGLTIRTRDCVIRTLIISRFSGHGIAIVGNGTSAISNNLITNCIIGGWNEEEAHTQANRGSGVFIQNSANNKVGEKDFGEFQNQILSNYKHGIHIEGATAQNNTIANNSIAGNDLDGIRIANKASNNKVGTYLENQTVKGKRNVIVNNGGHGVAVVIVATEKPEDIKDNEINGNLIGINPGTVSGLKGGNMGSGIFVAGKGTKIGGGTESLRNVISDNRRSGIEIVGGEGTIVLNNYIGTTLDGQGGYDSDGTNIGNRHHGVLIESTAAYAAKNNTIGDVDEGNVIANNRKSGVSVEGVANRRAVGNSIKHNTIGANAGNTAALVNDRHAINLILTDGTSIRSNKGYHARTREAILGFDAKRDTIKEENDFKRAPGEQTSGLPPTYRFVDSTELVFGGTGATDGDIIAGGLVLENSSSITIQGNYFGVDDLGNSLGNTGDAISIDALSQDITIGGVTSGAGNTIRYNGGAAVRTSGGNVTIIDNTIANNAQGLVIQDGETHLAVTTTDALTITAGFATIESASSVASVSVAGGTHPIPRHEPDCQRQRRPGFRPHRLTFCQYPDRWWSH